MSTIKTDTLQNVAGTKSVPVNTVVDGSAKAWVNFNGTGTVAIRAAFNVGSITDNGVGNYTVNYTAPMPDANYAAVAMVTYSGGPYITGHNSSVAQTASTLNIISSTTAGGTADSSIVTAVVFR